MQTNKCTFQINDLMQLFLVKPTVRPCPTGETNISIQEDTRTELKTFAKSVQLVDVHYIIV